jgi:hypothetical protein
MSEWTDESKEGLETLAARRDGKRLIDREYGDK